MTHGKAVTLAAVWLFLQGNVVIAGQEPSWTTSLPVLEREPHAQELVAYPADRSQAGVNPPGFCWTPHEGAWSYRLEVSWAEKPARIALRADNQGSTVYAPTQPMFSGEYVWQVVYRNEQGVDFGVSRTRRFALPAGLPQLMRPDMRLLGARLAGVRPRLHINGNRLEAIQEAVKQGSAPQWQFFLATADAALQESLYPERKPGTLTSCHTFTIFALVQFVIHLFERYALSMEKREGLNHYSLKPQESHSYEYEPRRGPGQ